MGTLQVTGRRASDISDAVERAIRDGQLRPGEQLPTVRSLADELQVSPTTVAAAYRQLRQRGIISTHGRGGTRVHQRPPLDVVIDEPLDVGIADLRNIVPEQAVLPSRADRLALTAPLATPMIDDPELGDRLGKDLLADDVDATHLAMAPGGASALATMLAANLRPGDRVAVEDPTDPVLRDLMIAEGYQIQPMRLDSRGLRPDLLADGLSESVHALVLTPRAQDPTATAFDEDRRYELLDVIDRHPGLLVIERDPHGPVAGVNYRTLSTGRARWAVIRSWGMALGLDFDITAVAGDATTIARFKGRQRLTGSRTPALMQAACAELLASEDAHRTILVAARTYGARRVSMLAELRNRGIVAQGLSGSHIWLPVDREDSVVGPLLHLGWAVAPGTRFRIASPPGIRIGVSNLSTDMSRRLADDLLEVLAA